MLNQVDQVILQTLSYEKSTVFDGIYDARACKTHPILAGQIQEKFELYVRQVRRRAIF